MNRIKSIIKYQYFNITFLLFTAGMYFIIHIPTYIAVALLFAAALILSAISIFTKTKNLLIFFALGLILASAFGIKPVNDIAVAKNLDGKFAAFSGVAVSQDERYTVIKLDFIETKSVSLKCRAAFSDVCVGDKIEGTAVFGAADSSNLKGDGILLTSESVYAEKVGESRFYKALHSFRTKINSVLDTLDKGFAKAIITGDRSGDIADTSRTLREAGASHLLAISGLHTTVIISIFSYLILLFVPTKPLKGISIILFAFFYSFIASLSPSVVRCAVMVSVLHMGNFFKRQTSILSALIFSAAFQCAIEPFVLFDASFLLSHLAVFAIVTVGVPTINATRSNIFAGKPKLKRSLIIRLLLKFGYMFIDGFILCVSISFFTLPVLLIYFGEMSVFVWISNIILIPIFSPVLFFAVFYLIFAGVGITFLSGIAKALYGFFYSFFIGISGFFAEVIPVIELKSPYTLVFAALDILLVIYIFIKKPPLKSVLIMMSAFLFVAGLFPVIVNY